jgi:fibronectin type 3 domain-containing protein
MRSLILPHPSTSSPSTPIQLFYSEAIALIVQQTASNHVNVGTINALDAIQITTTDDADSAALIQQINNAINSSSQSVSIAGNPASAIIPTLNSATGDYGQVELAWTADSNYAYNIYRSAVSGGGYTLVGTAPSGSTSYSDPITTGSVWYYVIRGVTNGGRESDASGEHSGTLLIPDTPASLAASNAAPYRAALTWDAVTPAGGSLFSTVDYRIYRDGSFYTSTNTNSLNDDGLTAAHDYSVSAVINGIEGAQCASVNCVPTTLAAPVITVAPSAYANSLTVSWPAVTNATGYNIYRSISTGTEVIIAGNVSSPFVDNALPSNTAFYYTVTAIANGGESPQSSEKIATPDAATFSSVATSPDPILAADGGTVTLVGTGLDSSQHGQIGAFGSYYWCDYSVAGQVTITVPAGETPSTVELYYKVGGYAIDTGFSVVFG